MQRRTQSEYAGDRDVAAIGCVDVDLAVIDADADVRAGVVEFPIAVAAFVVLGALRDFILRQDAIGHAQHFDAQLGNVDRLDGDAIGFRARQDDAAAGKADISRAIAEGEREGFIGGGVLARC